LARKAERYCPVADDGSRDEDRGKRRVLSHAAILRRPAEADPTYSSPSGPAFWLYRIGCDVVCTTSKPHRVSGEFSR
jgi:hypothetical protein